MKNINIKLIISLFIGTLFFSNFVYADCSYTSRDNSCEIFTSPFNSFNLNFTDTEDVESFVASIYDNTNHRNMIKLDIDYDNNVVRNINPFTKPGVYVLNVVVTNKAGNTYDYSKQYLFDNLKPNLPILPINLDSEINNVNVVGSALFAKEIIIADKYESEISRSNVLSDNTFIINLNLNTGINFFKFASVGKNGLVSDFVGRSIISKSNSVINFNPFVSNIVLDNNNLLNKIVSGVTLKRNIYISGNIGAANSRVFISGNPVVSDEIGNFGGFVNLNQGDNLIEVLAGNKSKSFGVSYVSDKFIFTNFKTKKFVSESTTILEVGALYDINFDVYLNGEFVSVQRTSLGVVNISLSGLRYGQNYIYLSGKDGNFIERIIYYDNKKPEISVISPVLVSDLNEFIFEVKDDYGFDITKTVFRLNSVIVSNDKLSVLGNYFVYDTEDLSSADYSYSVLIFDLAGNYHEVFGNFRILSDVTSIDSIDIVNGAVLGNRFFFKEIGSQSLTLNPSKNIAFKSISLDGEDQTDYKINKDNSIRLNLRLSEKMGNIDLEFIDSSKNLISQKFSYIIIDEPEVELDFISRPVLDQSKPFVVSGRIISDYFDWSSFRINSGTGKRFGNYFENYVSFDTSTVLSITGKDLMDNSLGYVFSGVGVDNDYTVLGFLDEGDDYFKGSIPSYNPLLLNYVESYDGIYSSQVLPQSFNLVSAQRSGLRNLNLKGIKESLKTFKYGEIISVDGLNPEIYFLSDKIVVLGTLSEVSDILVNGESVGLGDKCVDLIILGEFCKEIDIVSVGDEVTVIDFFGNSFSREYFGSIDNLDKSDIKLSFYFTGNDIYIDSTSSSIQGQFVSNEEVSSITTSFGTCQYDDFNFVCDVSLNSVFNNVNVIITTVSGKVVVDEINLTVICNPSDLDCTTNIVCPDSSNPVCTTDDEDNDNNGIDNDDDNDGIPDDEDNDNDNDGISDDEIDTDTPYVPLQLSLNDIYGERVYEIFNNYYFDTTLVNIDGDISKPVSIKLIINNEEMLVGSYDSRVNIIDVDLSEFVQNYDEVQLDMKLRGTDEFGVEKDSNVLILFYNRVLNTLVEIIIN